MLIKVQRHWFTDTTTSGVISIDGAIEGFTLEDEARPEGVKIPGKTCIQAGTYQVIVDHSVRFLRLMPRLLNVPMFEGVLIHPGNRAVDTAGCILIGNLRGPDVIWESVKCFERVFEKIKTAYNNKEEIQIQITNEPI